jgi:hypothetical protein
MKSNPAALNEAPGKLLPAKFYDACHVDSLLELGRIIREDKHVTDGRPMREKATMNSLSTIAYGDRTPRALSVA